MPRIDPKQLLKTLGVLLGPTGGIKSSKEVSRLVQLMQKFSRKLVSKCIYVQILKATEPDLLNEFLHANGWALLNQWFSDAITSRNWPLCVEMIGLFGRCPITADTLKENSANHQAPKLINQLRQEVQVGDHIRMLADQLYSKWVAIVSPGSPSKKVKSKAVVEDSEDSDDDKKSEQKNGTLSLLQSLADEVTETIRKEEKVAREQEKTSSKKKVISENSSKRKDKHHSSHHHKTSGSSSDKEKSSRKRESKESRPVHPESKRFRPDPRDEVNAEEKKRIKEMARRMKEEAQVKKTLSKVTSSSSLSGSKIPKIPKKKDGAKGDSFSDMMAVLDSKPKTVKTSLTKNKTAALLEGMTTNKGSSNSSVSSSSSSSSKHHKTSSSSSSSRKSSSHSNDRDRDRERDKDREKKSSSNALSKTKSSPSSEKSSDLKKLHRKNSSDSSFQKSPNLADSSSFMDAIFGSLNKPVGPRARKRRLSMTEKEDSKDDSKKPKEVKTQGKDDTKEDAKDEEKKESTPAPTFSFYRDTLDTSNNETTEAKTEEAKNEDKDGEEKNNSGSAEETNGKADESVVNEAEEEDTSEREVKGILVFHRGREKRNKKIRWKPDSDIVAVRYFELDADERINVNKIKFENMREFELRMEKAAIKQKGSISDEPEVTMTWYTPHRLTFSEDDNNKPCLTQEMAGGQSKEKAIQAERERTTLQALYFTKEMIPSNPGDPDNPVDMGLGRVGSNPPKNVPLEDKDADESSFHNYSNNPWPTPKVNKVDEQANLESHFSLPPALSSLLASIETTGLNSFLPSNPNNLSKEDQSTLAAQTEALQKLGMLPGVNMQPNFPPPMNQLPPSGRAPPMQANGNGRFGVPPPNFAPNFNQPPPMPGFNNFRGGNNYGQRGGGRPFNGGQRYW